MIKEYEIIKTYMVWETDTHIFKINDEAYEKLKDQKNWRNKMATKIQKSMKQKVDKASGEMWEQSYKEIYQKITDQTTL